MKIQWSGGEKGNLDSRKCNSTDRKLGLHDPVVKLDVPQALRGLLCPVLGLKLDKRLALERCVETGAPGAGNNEASDTPKVALALVDCILGNLLALLRRRASPQESEWHMDKTRMTARTSLGFRV
jgi:hypothetical protein